MEIPAKEVANLKLDIISKLKYGYEKQTIKDLDKIIIDNLELNNAKEVSRFMLYKGRVYETSQKIGKDWAKRYDLHESLHARMDDVLKYLEKIEIDKLKLDAYFSRLFVVCKTVGDVKQLLPDDIFRLLGFNHLPPQAFNEVRISEDTIKDFNRFNSTVASIFAERRLEEVLLSK